MPATDEELIAVAKASLADLQGHLKEDTNRFGKPWKLKGKGKAGTTVYESDSPHGTVFKGVHILPGPPAELWPCMIKPELRARFDSSVESITLSKVADTTVVLKEGAPPQAAEVSIIRSLTKSMPLISQRDFVDSSITLTDTTTGDIYSSCGAAPDSTAGGRFPEVKKVIRGQDHSGCGWWLTSITLPGEGADAAPRVATKVTYVIHSDIKGWIPASVINAAIEKTYTTFFSCLEDFLKTEEAAAVAAEVRARLAAAAGAAGGAGAA